MPDFNKAPFNFVPLNKDVFIPSWGKGISHDIPFSDGEDGIIRFTVKNLSPLFIKDKIDKDDTEHLSANIIDNAGQRHFFIPGTSLRGMTRSVLEIMSFGKLYPYNDDFFTYRIFNTKETDGANYVAKMRTVHCGWLRRSASDYDRYLIHDCGTITNQGVDVKCSGGVERIEMSKLPTWYQSVTTKDVPGKTKAFKDSGLGRYPDLNGKCLVCTGFMHNKQHEYLFEAPPKDGNGYEITVDDKTMEKFKSAYKPSREYHSFICEMLDTNEPLAVFFLKTGKEVMDIGITRMFRYPYEGSVSKGVGQTQHDENGNQIKDGRDMAECIFGYVDKDESLRGRVQFGNAFSSNKITPMGEMSGVLGEPKASFYPYYLRQQTRKGKYVTYRDSSFELAGRKRYRIDGSTAPRQLPAGNGNEKVTTKFHPLPSGNTFTCEVKLHNMKAVEVGAILSALTFHGTKGCHHNIGMAKGFGYGKLEISDITLKYLTMDKESYMKEFEKCMTKFCGIIDRWSSSEQMKALAAIASDHNELSYMNLEEYGKAKNNINFKTLSENGPCIPISLLSNDEFAAIFSPKPPIATSVPRDPVPINVPGNDDIERLSRGLNLKNAFKFKDINAKVRTYKNAMDREKVQEWREQDISTIIKKLKTVYSGCASSRNTHDRESMENRQSNWWTTLASLVGKDKCDEIFNKVIHESNEQTV